MQEFLDYLAQQPPPLLYLAVGLGAALENIFPPVPADTFVLFGAFLAAQGRANPWIAYAVTTGGNVASALLTYWLGRRYGRPIFRTRIGHMILRPGQIDQIESFYGRYGKRTIFFSRFLPGLRAVVPVFAGVSHIGFWRTALPLTAASAIWYGFVFAVGTLAGHNWQAILDAFSRYNTILAILGGLLLTLAGWWWWRSRRRSGDSA